MVKAFASGEGLAYLLSKAGIASQAQSQDVVSRFTRGFSQADDMFDFVLVGKGKDRADHKLMGEFPVMRFPSRVVLSDRDSSGVPTVCRESLMPANPACWLPRQRLRANAGEVCPQLSGGGEGDTAQVIPDG